MKWYRGILWNLKQNITLEKQLLSTEKKETILACHLYVGESKHTERYYLGNKKWVTIKEVEYERKAD